MALTQITYTNKETLNEQPSIADKNKVKADDMNEIKSVVNTNASNVGDLTNLTTTNKNSIVESINELNDRDTYSTTEKVVGTWIDGKPIYRRVISGVYQSGTTLVSNVSTLIHVYGCGDVGTGVIRTIPYYEIYDNRVYLLDIRKNGNNVVVNAQKDGSSASTSIGTNITIEYTKTTD